MKQKMDVLAIAQKFALLGPKPELQKDQSKLFEDVDEKVYAKLYGQLQKMRSDHPSYRDDQLLMRLLCALEPVQVENLLSTFKCG